MSKVIIDKWGKVTFDWNADADTPIVDISDFHFRSDGTASDKDFATAVLYQIGLALIENDNGTSAALKKELKRIYGEG